MHTDRINRSLTVSGRVRRRLSFFSFITSTVPAVSTVLEPGSVRPNSVQVVPPIASDMRSSNTLVDSSNSLTSASASHARKIDTLNPRRRFAANGLVPFLPDDDSPA